MSPNILFQYLQWHLVEMPKEILKGWRNFLWFNLNYFSVPVLARTLFSPWRRYAYEYGKHFDIGRWFEAFTFNLMSRGIGAVLRIIFILVGSVTEILVFFAGLVIFCLWMFLPMIIIIAFLSGVKLLF